MLPDELVASGSRATSGWQSARRDLKGRDGLERDRNEALWASVLRLQTRSVGDDGRKNGRAFVVHLSVRNHLSSGQVLDVWVGVVRVGFAKRPHHATQHRLVPQPMFNRQTCVHARLHCGRFAVEGLQVLTDELQQCANFDIVSRHWRSWCFYKTCQESGGLFDRELARTHGSTTVFAERHVVPGPHPANLVQ